MKLISEFNDYGVQPVIVEQNEKGEKGLLHRRYLYAI